MTPFQKLGKRAVAAPGWRWLLGSVDVDGYRVLYKFENNKLVTHNASGCKLVDPKYLAFDYPKNKWWSNIPDLVDDATRGCVAALAASWAGNPNLYVAPFDGEPSRRWAAVSREKKIAFGPGRLEALIATLELPWGCHDERY